MKTKNLIKESIDTKYWIFDIEIEYNSEIYIDFDWFDFFSDIDLDECLEYIIFVLQEKYLIEEEFHLYPHNYEVLNEGLR